MRKKLIRCALNAALCLVAVACDEPHQPTAPSLPSVVGTYDLTITRCALPDATTAPAAALFPPRFTAVPGLTVVVPWTLTQNGREVTGSTTGSVPPFVWSGTLNGTITSATRIEIGTFNYRDSSSHVGIHNFSGTGTATITDGLSGALTADYTFTPTFGGFAGPTTACHGDQLPMRFSRRE